MLEQIVNIVLDELQLKREDFLIVKKTRDVTDARALICYFALGKKFTQKTVAEQISMSPSNVWHSEALYHKRYKNDAKFRHLANKISQEISSLRL